MKLKPSAVVTPILPINTEPPFTPNPVTWLPVLGVHLGNYILGEDIVDRADLGFCGETVTLACPTCGELFGHVPVELVGEVMEDPTIYHITPLVAWHFAKYHPRLA